MKLIQTINYLKIKEHKGEYLVYDVTKKLRFTGKSHEEAINYCLNEPQRINQMLKEAFDKLDQ
jgi:hypothetical protein